MQSPELSPERLRELAELRPGSGPVLSLFLDLDPKEFATGAARDTAVTSLLDDARRQVREAGADMDETLEQVEGALRGLDADGAHGLALFAGDGVWQEVRLPRRIDSSVHVAARPRVEGLTGLADGTTWCVLLVNRRLARVLTGGRDSLVEVGRIEDDVHQQHGTGGQSQARLERSVEEDVRRHLQRVAHALRGLHQRRPFDALLVGGPEEIVPQFEGHLERALQDKVADHIRVDVENVTVDEVASAADSAFAEHEAAAERDALERLQAGLGTGGRAAAGWDAVREALVERRVDVLLLPAGARGDDVEEAVEQAVEGAGRVLRINDEESLAGHEGVAALLRW